MPLDHFHWVGVEFDSLGVRSVHQFVTLLPSDSLAAQALLTGPPPTTEHTHFEFWTLEEIASRQDEWW